MTIIGVGFRVHGVCPMRILYVSPLTKLKYGRDTYDIGLSHCYLAAYVLQNADFPVTSRIVSKNVQREIYEFRPEIVAISGMTYNFHAVITVAAAARSAGAKVIVGGHHISVLPQALTRDMDVGVLSEGEQTFLELVRLAKQNRWGPEYWKNVRGVVFYAPDRSTFITPHRPLIQDLDSVGHPVRELAPRMPTILEAVVTSRGCPYSCLFCYESRFWHNRVRFHSPEYVIREIECVHRLSGTDRIRLDDSVFLISKTRIKKLLSYWKRHKLYGKISFSCSARANKIDNGMAELAKEFGVTNVFFGFESNNRNVLSFLKLQDVAPEDNQRAYDILTRNNISVEGSIIIGSPRESLEQMMDTYRFLKRNPLLNITEVSHLVPLPGTPVWDYAVRRGLVSESMDFSKLGGQKTHHNAIFLSEVLDRDEVVRGLRKFRRLMWTRRIALRWRRRIMYLFNTPLLLPRQTVNYLKRKLGRMRVALR